MWKSGLLEALRFVLESTIGLSRESNNPVYTLVIVESWPLLTAIAYPLFRIGTGKRVGVFEILFALISVVGIALIALIAVLKCLNSSEIPKDRNPCGSPLFCR